MALGLVICRVVVGIVAGLAKIVIVTILAAVADACYLLLAAVTAGLMLDRIGLPFFSSEEVVNLCLEVTRRGMPFKNDLSVGIHEGNMRNASSPKLGIDRAGTIGCVVVLDTLLVSLFYDLGLECVDVLVDAEANDADLSLPSFLSPRTLR